MHGHARAWCLGVAVAVLAALLCAPCSQWSAPRSCRSTLLDAWSPEARAAFHVRVDWEANETVLITAGVHARDAWVLGRAYTGRRLCLEPLPPNATVAPLCTVPARAVVGPPSGDGDGSGAVVTVVLGAAPHSALALAPPTHLWAWSERERSLPRAGVHTSTASREDATALSIPLLAGTLLLISVGSLVDNAIEGELWQPLVAWLGYIYAVAVPLLACAAVGVGVGGACGAPPRILLAVALCAATRAAAAIATRRAGGFRWHGTLAVAYLFLAGASLAPHGTRGGAGRSFGVAAELATVLVVSAIAVRRGDGSGHARRACDGPPPAEHFAGAAVFAVTLVPASLRALRVWTSRGWFGDATWGAWARDWEAGVCGAHVAGPPPPGELGAWGVDGVGSLRVLALVLLVSVGPVLAAVGALLRNK
jgi:hypothetical protein